MKTVSQLKQETRSRIVDADKNLKHQLWLLSNCIVNIEDAEELLNDEDRIISEHKKAPSQSVEEIKVFLRSVISEYKEHHKRLVNIISERQKEIEKEVQGIFSK